MPKVELNPEVMGVLGDRRKRHCHLEATVPVTFVLPSLRIWSESVGTAIKLVKPVMAGGNFFDTLELLAGR